MFFWPLYGSINPNTFFFKPEDHINNATGGKYKRVYGKERYDKIIYST